MAASSKENDYCSQLQHLLGVSVTPTNISNWERNFSTDLRDILSANQSDVIVIRIGENVSDVNGFYSALVRLINLCNGYSKQVVITGCLWPNFRKEIAILAAAIRTRTPYIRLDHIAKRNDVYPQIGDTLYDMDGKPYTIKKDFIIIHPNDLGMRLITEEIYKKKKKKKKK